MKSLREDAQGFGAEVVCLRQTQILPEVSRARLEEFLKVYNKKNIKNIENRIHNIEKSIKYKEKEEPSNDKLNSVKKIKLTFIS